MRFMRATGTPARAPPMYSRSEFPNFPVEAGVAMIITYSGIWMEDMESEIV